MIHIPCAVITNSEKCENMYIYYICSIVHRSEFEKPESWTHDHLSSLVSCFKYWFD